MNTTNRMLTFQAAERNDARKLNLNVYQHHAACLIYFDPDRCVRHYADKMGIGSADMSHLVDKLVGEGYIKRTRTLVDHRKVILKLTDKGKSMIGAIMHPQTAEKNSGSDLACI